jgi:isoleucyl-tRNA synthetase
VIFLQPPQWFAAIDKPLGRRQDTYGTTIRERALRSIDELVTWTPVRAQPPALDDRGAARLGAVAPARLGRAADLLRQEGRGPDDPDFLLRDPAVNARILEAFEAEGADAWYKPGAKARFLGNDHDPDEYESRSSTSSTCGSTAAPPTPSCCATARTGPRTASRMSTWRAPTSIAAGSIPRCCRPAAPRAARPTRRADPRLHARREGHEDVQVARQHHRPEEVIKQYGADILRLWVAQTDYTADQRIGPEILKGVADSYRRLRNTMRFMLGSLADFTEADRVAPADMPELERWVLHRLAELDARCAPATPPMTSRACSRRCSTSPR